MPNIVVGDRVQITVNIAAFNQRLMSIFCYGCSSLTGAANHSDMFDRLHTAITAVGGLVSVYRAALCPEFAIDSVWYQIIAPLRYSKFTRTAGLGAGLLAANNAFSANQAAVILRRGDFGTRNNVSTLHVPIGQTPGCQANGGIGGDLEVPLFNLADKMKQPINTTTIVSQWDPVINHGPNVGDYTPIVNTAVEPNVRTMNRRTVGRGI